jgi:hypothetical protein
MRRRRDSVPDGAVLAERSLRSYIRCMPWVILDLDGVLADFDSGVCTLFGVDPPVHEHAGDGTRSSWRVGLTPSCGQIGLSP